MGLFGGSKSSSTSNVEETSTQNVDNRVTEGEKNVIGGNTSIVVGDSGDGGGGVNITQTDLGALDAATEISDSAFKFSDSAVSKLGAATNAALSIAKGSTQDEGARTTQLLIIGAVSLGAVFLLIKLGKK